MDRGDGVWHGSGVGIEAMHIKNVPPIDLTFQCGDAPTGSGLWAVSSFQAQMASAGTARFGLRISAVPAGTPAGPVLQLRKIGAAVVGTGWDRMFAEPTVRATDDTKCGDESAAGAGGDVVAAQSAMLRALGEKMARMEHELAQLKQKGSESGRAQ